MRVEFSLSFSLSSYERKILFTREPNLVAFLERICARLQTKNFYTKPFISYSPHYHTQLFKCTQAFAFYIRNKFFYPSTKLQFLSFRVYNFSSIDFLCVLAVTVTMNGTFAQSWEWNEKFKKENLFLVFLEHLQQVRWEKFRFLHSIYSLKGKVFSKEMFESCLPGVMY